MKSMMKWLLSDSPASEHHQVEADPLDFLLLHFSDDPADAWTIRDACEGTQIFGGTGSGKTSASGRLLAHAFLRSGAGGLVLTCKPDERRVWERYCLETGRIQDFVVFSPSNQWRFNFMQHEFNRSGAGGRITENLVRLFATLAEVLERGHSTSGPDYWSRAMNQLVRNAIDLATISRGIPTLDFIANIIASAATCPEEVRSADWQDSSACYSCIVQGEKADKNELQRADWPQVVRFWTSEFPSLNSRTRSCIVSMFTTLGEQFLRGEIRRLFCEGINLDPECTFNDRKILLIDLPVKEYGEVGVLSQVLWKFVWQRAVERRDVRQHPWPCFLWADEAQYFTTRYDATFQTTSRSVRVMTTYITQSLPNYYSTMGRNETDALLANLATRIWHRNSCTVTNQAAAETVSRIRQYRLSVGMSTTDGPAGDQRMSRNIGGADSVDYQLLPGDFQFLRSGGPPNQYLVDGIVYKGGKTWSTGSNYLHVTFPQRS